MRSYRSRLKAAIKLATRKRIYAERKALEILGIERRLEEPEALKLLKQVPTVAARVKMYMEA